jgi:hypothetical protein
MKILIGNIILARGVESSESPYDMSIRNEREVQIATTLRGESARGCDRGNRRTTLNFKVAHRHNSTEEAQKFVLTHAASLSNLATSVKIIEEPSGHEFILPDAAIIGIQSSSAGNVSVHEYRIVGGNFFQA